ncbi:MAG: hypothetical protein WCK03_04665, partial [Candidatus Taylorbacteria bacterium]
MKKISLWTLALLLSGGVSQAATYYISPTGNDANIGSLNYPIATIQTAINRAKNGDTIFLGNGIYSGTNNNNLQITNITLTITSSNGPKSTFVDGGQNKLFTISSSGTNNVTIEGITFTNGYSTTPDFHDTSASLCTVLGSKCSAIIKNCIFTGNTQDCQTAGGFGWNATTALLECYSANIVKMESCLINNNTIWGAQWMMVGPNSCFMLCGNLQIINCYITDNKFKNYGSHLNQPTQQILSISSGMVINCTITGNTETSPTVNNPNGNVINSTIQGVTISINGTFTNLGAIPELYCTTLGSSNTSALQEINSNGIATNFSSGLPGSCRGVSFDEDGNLYTANKSNNLILEIAPDGSSSTFASLPTNSAPVGVAFDTVGNLYVANQGTNQTTGNVTKISTNGQISIVSYSVGVPGAIAVDPSDNIFIGTYTSNASLIKIATNGSVSTYASGGGLSYVTGIALDPSTNIYVSNQGTNSTRG